MRSESQSFWVRAESVLLWLSLFLIPWQLRHTVHFDYVNGGYFEYGSMHIYAQQIVVIALLGCWLIRSRLRPVVIVPSLALTALVIWMGLTAFWARDLGVAVYSFLNWMLALLWIIYITSNEVSSKDLIRPFVWGVTLQAGIGILQFMANGSLGLRVLGESVLDPLVRGVPVVVSEGTRQLRAHGFLPHANAFGGFLVLGLIGLTVQGKIGIELAVQAVGLVVAFARSAWLGLGVAFVAIAAAVGRRAARPMVEIGLVFLISMAFLYNYALARVTVEGPLEVRSVQERIAGLDTWREVIQDGWVVGLGIGNYPLELVRRSPDLEAWAYQPVHNAFLLHGAELGVIGLLLFLWLAWEVWRKLLREGPNTGHIMILALWVIGLVDHWPITLEQGRMVVFLALVLTFLDKKVLLSELKRL